MTGFVVQGHICVNKLRLKYVIMIVMRVSK